MNAVYPLGKGSHWGNNEIRFSVRSLEMFTSIREVFIVGENPGFGNHIPYRETQHPAVNIWEKLVEACLTDEISDPFLFINDDHYFIKPVEIESYPNYYAYRISEYPSLKIKHGGNPYYQLVERTFKILGDVLFFNVHCPCLIHKQKFLDCFETYRQEIYTEGGLLVKTTYLQNEPGVQMDDYKIRFNESYQTIIDNIKDRHVFSSGEYAFEGTQQVLKQIFKTF